MADPWVLYAVAAVLLASIAAVAIFTSRRLTELDMRVKTLTETVIPISAAFRSVLIRELTHNHTPELDALLQKLEPTNKLTSQEEVRLAVLLRERVVEFNDPLITDSERDAAAMLPMVLKRVQRELEAEVLAVQAVVVPKL